MTRPTVLIQLLTYRPITMTCRDIRKTAMMNGGRAVSFQLTRHILILTALRLTNPHSSRLSPCPREPQRRRICLLRLPACGDGFSQCNREFLASPEMLNHWYAYQCQPEICRPVCQGIRVSLQSSQSSRDDAFGASFDFPAIERRVASATSPSPSSPSCSAMN